MKSKDIKVGEDYAYGNCNYGNRERYRERCTVIAVPVISQGYLSWHSLADAEAAVAKTEREDSERTAKYRHQSATPKTAALVHYLDWDNQEKYKTLALASIVQPWSDYAPILAAKEAEQARNQAITDRGQEVADLAGAKAKALGIALFRDAGPRGLALRAMPEDWVTLLGLEQ